jgi:hypothetical protein
MTTKKQKTSMSVSIWVNIDFKTVKNTIETINSQIEEILQRYEFQENYKSEDKKEN